MTDWIPADDITKDPKRPGEKSNKYNFRLLNLKVLSEKTQKEREIIGWWNGFEWEGARLSTSDKVLFWKREYGM